VVAWSRISAGPVERLARPSFAGWSLSLYPAAAEAGGCFVSSRPRKPVVRGGPTADPERARIEAGRRAKGRVRRYCAANRLNRLGTLTYAGAGCHDPRQVRADVGAFFRSLRRTLGGEPFPYLWVPEWHKTDHGLHVHFAVGQYVPRGDIKQAWGRGHVHIKLLGDLPVGAGALGEARKAAGYLSKYVAKSFTDDADGVKRPKGLHRFDAAEDFAPTVTRLTATTADGVLARACEVMGAAPALRWNSADAEDWRGAPAIWAQWA
jgi:hypothetical protein